MSPERARYILENTRLGGDYRFAFRKRCDSATARIYADGITEAEDADIKALWETMPGWTTYAMALCRIAREET